MAEAAKQQPLPEPQNRPADRLESWKSIAAYLGRDVRTVQRWERDRELPVHRLRRNHRSLPYAFRQEIDAWWATRSSIGECDNDEKAGSAPKRRTALRYGWLFGVSVVVLTAVAAAWPRFQSLRPSAKAAPTITTRSGTARKLYSQADAMIAQDRNSEAETLLREAVGQDPEFASAHILLAWSVRNQNRPASDYLPIAAHAEQLSAGASESERLFIRGSALWFRGDERQACALYEALVKIQPDHFWGVNNLMDCIQRDGDPAAVANLWSQLADSEAEDFDKNVLAGWANRFLIGDAVRGGRYLERAEQLQRTGARGVGVSDAWLRLLPAYEHWLDDTVPGAVDSLTRTLARDVPLESSAQQELWREAGGLLLVFGRLDDAQRTFNRIQVDSIRAGYLALVDFARGDVERARKHLLLCTPVGVTAAILSARLGLLERARATLAERTPSGPSAAAIQGELAFQAGDMDQAIELLTLAVRHPYGQPPYFLAAETLANALVHRGKLVDAIEVVETVVPERSHAYDPAYGGTFTGYAWLRVRLLQAELYARAGRLAESRQVASHIVKLLAVADPDSPILKRAGQLAQRP